MGIIAQSDFWKCRINVESSPSSYYYYSNHLWFDPFENCSSITLTIIFPDFANCNSSLWHLCNNYFLFCPALVFPSSHNGNQSGQWGQKVIYTSVPLQLTSWFIFYALLRTMERGGQKYLLAHIFNVKKRILHFVHLWHLKWLRHGNIKEITAS